MPRTKRRGTDTSVRDFGREEVRATVKEPRTPEPAVDGSVSIDGREFSVDDDQRRKSTDRSQRSTPWDFWLVLTAIVVVAVVYSVTLYFIGGEIKNPATAIGAMTAAFAVIGTLVGTYFGIKAGLDGQDKVKESLDMAARDEERRRDRALREY